MSVTALDGVFLDQALARAGDGACLVNAEGRILIWNRAAETILGYPAREVIGRPCCDVFVGRDGDGNRLCYQGCHVMSLVRMGDAIQSFDMRTETKAGQAVWLNVSILAMPREPRTNGHGGAVLHLFRDVTATRELLRMVHERVAAGSEDPLPEAAASLTRRELEVLRLLAAGSGTKAVADRLHVSPATVRNHVQNIFGKLGAHSRLEAVAHATRYRLL
jgi:PAS domain S-box-containing protein